MVHRKTIPADGNCGIALTTEQMKDGGWAVVVSVVQSMNNAQRVVDLPIPAERFPSEAEAERHGIGLARDWIDRNTPRVA